MGEASSSVEVSWYSSLMVWRSYESVVLSLSMMTNYYSGSRVILNLWYLDCRNPWRSFSTDFSILNQYSAWISGME